jgi:hypothetical protein
MPVKVRRSRRASKRHTKSPKRVARRHTKKHAKKAVKKHKTPKRRVARVSPAQIKRRVAKVFSKLKPETKARLRQLIQSRMTQA